MQMLDVKMVFTSFKKMHLEMKTSMNKSKKTAPSWSYILTHLVAIDKFFEIWSNLRRLEFELHL